MAPWALSILIRLKHLPVLQSVIEYFLSALFVLKLMHRQILYNYEILAFLNMQILIYELALTVKLLFLKQINNFVVIYL